MDIPGVQCFSKPEGNLFILTRGNLRLEISEWGATLRRCVYKGRDRRDRDLVLGYGNPDRFLENNYYLSSTVGRYANRLNKGQVQIAGKKIQLAVNNGVNHLHGGPTGYQVRRWSGVPCEGRVVRDGKTVDFIGVTFTYHSPDGEEHYPGALTAQVLAGVTDQDELFWVYRAASDKTTIVNLTNHAYWNLNGDGGTIHDHQMKLHCTGWLEVDAGSIPTGEFKTLAGSPWDFSQKRTLGPSLSDPAFRQASKLSQGIDHCFLVDPREKTTPWAWETGASLEGIVLRPTAELEGRDLKMEVFNSLPGVQVYTSNFLDVEPGLAGKLGLHGGVCLETQLLPDSPNQVDRFRQIGRENGWTEAEMKGWDAVLNPGETWVHATVHRFSPR